MDERVVEFTIRVVHAKGMIQADCQPTLVQNFVYDEIPRAGFHAMRALANAIAELLSQQPTVPTEA